MRNTAFSDCTDAGDHELFVCDLLKQLVLYPQKTVTTNDFLKIKSPYAAE